MGFFLGRQFVSLRRCMGIYGIWELGRMEGGAISATRCKYIHVRSAAASLRPKVSEIAPPSILRIVRTILSQRIPLQPRSSPPPTSLGIEQPSITTKVSKEENAIRAEDGRGHCFPGLRPQGRGRRAYMGVFTGPDLHLQPHTIQQSPPRNFAKLKTVGRAAGRSDASCWLHSAPVDR